MGDGDAALAAVRRAPPALLLADVMMPGHDGLALCRIVKSDPALADVPVVLLSARGGQEALMDGWLAGADEYLFKPFHPQELVTHACSDKRAGVSLGWTLRWLIPKRRAKPGTE